MKSLEDLKRLREQALKKVELREVKDGYRVVVGMATCGIAAGARNILNGFLEKVGEKGLKNVMVSQVGCIGECTLEPIVDVINTDGDKTTYCLVTKEMIDEIVESHLLNNKPIEKYTLSYVKDKRG